MMDNPRYKVAPRENPDNDARFVMEDGKPFVYCKEKAIAEKIAHALNMEEAHDVLVTAIKKTLDKFEDYANYNGGSDMEAASILCDIEQILKGVAV